MTCCLLIQNPATSIVAKKKKLELIFLGAKNLLFFYLFFWKQHLINFLKTLQENNLSSHVLFSTLKRQIKVRDMSFVYSEFAHQCSSKKH
jgi:hypothetical protein